jgi:hypothetical protein
MLPTPYPNLALVHDLTTMVKVFDESSICNGYVFMRSARWRSNQSPPLRAIYLCFETERVTIGNGLAHAQMAYYTLLLNQAFPSITDSGQKPKEVSFSYASAYLLLCTADLKLKSKHLTNFSIRVILLPILKSCESCWRFRCGSGYRWLQFSGNLKGAYLACELRGQVGLTVDLSFSRKNLPDNTSLDGFFLAGINCAAVSA